MQFRTMCDKLIKSNQFHEEHSSFFKMLLMLKILYAEHVKRFLW